MCVKTFFYGAHEQVYVPSVAHHMNAVTQKPWFRQKFKPMRNSTIFQNFHIKKILQEKICMKDLENWNHGYCVTSFISSLFIVVKR